MIARIAGRFAPGHSGAKPKIRVDVARMREALAAAGNVAGAARILGVGRITLWRRAREAGLL